MADAIYEQAKELADVAALGRLMRAAATPGAARAHYLHAFRNLDVRDDLARVVAPTLVIDTGGATTADSAYIADHIRSAELVRVPSRAVLLFGDDFDDAVSEASSFLTGKRLDQRARRRLVTLMFTDIVASTEHLATLGDRRWRTILDAHDSVVRHALDRFGGTEINTTGDGFLAAFDSPTNAIRCGSQVLSALDSLDLQGRIGLHSGECEVRGEDLAGMAVHTAARVADTAQAGEIIVSRTVADLLLGSDIELVEHAETELKGIPGGWMLYRYLGKPSADGR